MKIGIDVSRINLEQKTGTEWYSYYIIKNLLNIDQQNQYFLFSREELPIEFSKYPQAQNIVLKWPLKKFWTLNKLSLSLKNYNLDLFFTPAHNLPLTKIKKVITWHDCGYEYFPDHYSKTQLLSLKMGAKGLEKAGLIIAPSQNTKNDIIKFYGIGEDRIFVVPHGIDFEKYQDLETSKDVLERYNITKGYLLYIGRLEAKKNIVNLIKSFNSLKEKNHDFQLVLIGKESIGFEEIKEEIENSKYQKDIKLIGWVNEKDKISLLRKAKLFCLVSHFEGFGMSILEAMLCKVPVLVSNLQVFKELGINDSCFTENNIGNISSQMEELSTNQELRNNVIEKNLEAVQNFNWRKSAQETLEVFQRLMNKMRYISDTPHFSRHAKIGNNETKKVSQNYGI